MGARCSTAEAANKVAVGGLSDEVRQAIRNALIDNAMFNEVMTQRNLSDADLTRVINKFRLESFGKDETVFSYGDPGDRCYFVWKGGIDVFSNEGIKLNTKGSIGSGSIFGEIGFLHGSTRQATIMTNKTSQLYYLTLNGFEAATSFSPNLEDLADVPVLKATLSMDQLERLSRSKMQTRSFRQKEYICSAATTEKFFYIIIRGNVRLSSVTMSMKEIEELGKYDYFGEVSLINDAEQICQHCAQAYSAGETTVAMIDEKTFNDDPDCAPLREFLKRRIKNARKLHHKRQLHLQSKSGHHKHKHKQSEETKEADAPADAKGGWLPCNLNPLTILTFGGPLTIKTSESNSPKPGPPPPPQRDPPPSPPPSR